MGHIKKAAKAAKKAWKAIPDDTKIALAKKAKGQLKKIRKEQEEDFRKKLEQMTDDELSSVYIPDVYQKDIYAVDYEKWKERGIKLISFDIDDTIAAWGAKEVSQTVHRLFKDLKRMGFTVVLLTNNTDEKGRSFGEELGVDYVARAKKPYRFGFQTVLMDYEERYHETLEKSQMAHVGNHLGKDIAGGNMFGITTCLVRRLGKLGKPGTKIQTMVGANKNHIVRDELKKRGLWYAHHQQAEGDQYYQLGEEPRYRRNNASGIDIAKRAADDLIQKWNAHKNETYSLEEILRNSHEQKRSAGLETLRAHLGEDIMFTEVREEDIRELEEHELRDGEMSAFLFPVGGYLVRQASCLYQDTDDVRYTERIPAGGAEIAAYKEMGYRARGNCRDACEISAKYKDGEWQHICFADVSLAWAEEIDFICAVKGGVSAPDDQAALFVLKNNIGSSFSVEHWYRFTPDGAVKEYQVHPFDEDSFRKPWTLHDADEK